MVFRKKYAILLIAFSAVFFINAPSAFAVDTKKVKSTCTSKVAKSIRSKACVDANIKIATDAAKKVCANTKKADRENCETNNAIKYITTAANSKPKNVQDFVKQLKSTTKKAVDSANSAAKPNKNAKNNIVGQSKISAGDLPNQTDGAVDSNMVGTILGIVFPIIGAFALIVVVIAGLRYIVAAGDPQKTAQAKNTIVYALIGLCVAIFAQTIVVFVVKRV